MSILSLSLSLSLSPPVSVQKYMGMEYSYIDYLRDFIYFDGRVRSMVIRIYVFQDVY